MSRNACENRRNGNDFHSGHRKQNVNFPIENFLSIYTAQTAFPYIVSFFP
jgi:hypothetical protein